LSERNANAHAAFPHDAAALARGAIEHLEAARQVDEFQQLQAGAAGRIIDQDAVDRRRLGVGEDFGDARNPALRSLARVQPRMLHARELFWFFPGIFS